MGKLLASALKTIPSATFKQDKIKKERENAAAHDFVDKSLCEESGPHLS